jgi:hypothetical protein
LIFVSRLFCTSLPFPSISLTRREALVTMVTMVTMFPHVWGIPPRHQALWLSGDVFPERG